MAFVLDNVVMRQFYLQVHRLYCVNIVPPIVHAHSFITKSHLTSASDIVVKRHSLKKKVLRSFHWPDNKMWLCATVGRNGPMTKAKGRQKAETKRIQEKKTDKLAIFVGKDCRTI